MTAVLPSLCIVNWNKLTSSKLAVSNFEQEQREQRRLMDGLDAQQEAAPAEVVTQQTV